MALPAGRAIRGGGAPLWRRGQGGRILAAALVVLLPHAAFGAAFAELVEVRSATHPGFTRVVLETNLAVPFSIENRSRGELPTIEVHFPAAATAPRIGSARAPVTGVRIEQVGEDRTHARFVVTDAVDVWTNRLEDPPRIVLDLRPAAPLAAVVGQDPEDLTDEPYQIVVEPEQDESVSAAPEPIESPAPDTIPPAVTATPSAAPPQTRVAAAPPANAAAKTPPVAASPDASRASDGLPWTRVLFSYAPWSWIVLAWIGVAFAFLLIARFWRSRDPGLDRLPLDFSRPRAASGAGAPSLADEAHSAPQPADAAAESTPTVEPAGAPEYAEPLPSEPGEEASGAAVPDFLKVLRSLDRRIARLESEMAGTRELRESLVAQSAAQGEELRAQRAAVARLTRRPNPARPGEARPSAPPPSSS